MLTWCLQGEGTGKGSSRHGIQALCHMVPAASVVCVLPLLTRAQRHLGCVICVYLRSWGGPRCQDWFSFLIPFPGGHAGLAHSRCSLMLSPPSSLPLFASLPRLSCVLPPSCSYSTLYASEGSYWYSPFQLAKHFYLY